MIYNKYITYIYRNIFFSALININRKIAYRCAINSRGVLQNLLHTAPFRQFSFDITNPFLLHVLIGCKDLNFSMHHSILTTVLSFQNTQIFYNDVSTLQRQYHRSY